jgi:carbon-monoxide dehydrogenase small subunit
MQLNLTINGQSWAGDIEDRLSLADLLRQRVGLTGTHVGCEHGVCGACVVLLDGSQVRSCLVLAAQAQDCTVKTVEGLATDGALSPLQVSFIECHAFQCGFCTPGFLMMGQALLDAGEHLTREEIRHELSGNICRCTGYAPIVEAVYKCQK